MQITSTVTIGIQVTCEACDHEFTYQHELKEHGSNWTNFDKAFAARLADVRPEKLPFKSCPECGFLQSWMINKYKLDRVLMSAVLAALVPLILGIFFVGWPKSEDGTSSATLLGYTIVMFAFSLIGGFWAYFQITPNKKWLEKNGGRKITPRRPTLTV